MGPGLLEVLPTGRAARRPGFAFKRCDRRPQQRLQPEAVSMATATKEELTRVWEWTGRLIEELGALQDELARLTDETEDEEPEEAGRWID